MRVLGGHRALGRHPGVSQGVASLDLPEPEPLDHVLGKSLLLVELDGVARAHQPKLGTMLRDPVRRARRGQGARQGGVAPPHLQGHTLRLRAACGGQRLTKRGPVVLGILVMHGDLRAARLHWTPVDGEPGAVRAAVAQLDQHGRDQRPEPRAQLRVLRVESDDSAHDGAPAPPLPGAKHISLPAPLPPTRPRSSQDPFVLRRERAALPSGSGGPAGDPEPAAPPHRRPSSEATGRSPVTAFTPSRALPIPLPPSPSGCGAPAPPATFASRAV